MPEPTSPEFEISESRASDGTVTVALRGELDLAVAEQVNAAIARLRAERTPVQLDISQLGFIDSTGLQCLFLAVRLAREENQSLTIGREMAPPIQRVIDLVDAHRLLWPESPTDGSPQRPAE